MPARAAAYAAAEALSREIHQRQQSQPARPGRRATGWDKEPLHADLAPTLRQQACEIYCGNLGQVDCETLRTALEALFEQLPAFREAYPEGTSAVLRVARGGREAPYAFATLRDSVLASTAVLFSGFRLCGREVSVGWAGGRMPVDPVRALDVEPLLRLGLLVQKRTAVAHKPANRVGCEAYIGNMPTGKVREDELRCFLERALAGLTAFDGRQGPAVTRLDFNPEGSYCFATFQSEALKKEAMPHLHGLMFMGRRLKEVLRYGFDPRRGGEMVGKMFGLGAAACTALQQTAAVRNA